MQDTMLTVVGMQQCSVGLFNLPGLTFDRPLDSQLIERMKKWCHTNNCGQYMTPSLWSFRNAKQRDMFILRWSEEIINRTD